MKALNILLADASETESAFVGDYLRGAGHEVTAVRSGEAALEAYRARAFDLVLVDTVLDGLCALDAVKQIKAVPKTIWVPVILMASDAADEALLDAFIAGADDLFLKPLQPLALDIRIRSLMRAAAVQRATTAVIDSVDEGIIQIDRVGRIGRFNKAAERIFGYAEAEVLGQNVRMLMPPPDRDRHDDYLATYVATGQARIIGTGRRVTGRRRNGEDFAMHLGISEANTPDGRYFVGMVHDLSAEERLQAQVADNERFMRQLVDVLPGMVGYWTAELRCGFANRAYLEWFGKAPEAMRGLHIQEVMGEALFAKNEPFIRAALRGEPQQFERALAKADGRPGRIWTQYIPDRDGEAVRGFFVLAADITDLKAPDGPASESSAEPLAEPPTPLPT